MTIVRIIFMSNSKIREKRGDLQKKKKKNKRSTPVGLQNFCSLRPENDTKRAAKQMRTFFFFWRSPLFSQFLEARP